MIHSTTAPADTKTSQPTLKTEKLSVNFGGHTVVNGVTAEFHPGTLTAIVGPNGAGKTTYFNLVSGQIPSTSGEIYFKGEAVTAASASRRARLGMGRAFQLTNLFPRLTVLENIRLVVQANTEGPHARGLDFWSIWDDHKTLSAKAESVLAQVALSDKRHQIAATLSHGDQRKLEIGMLIALNPSIYLLDEPTAGMHASEAPVLLDLIARLKSDPTKTIILVEHKMDVVRALADRVIVLHNGTLVADGKPAEVMALPVVQVAYLGAAAA